MSGFTCQDLFGVSPSGPYSLLRAWERRGRPSRLLPIGMSPSGDRILLSLRAGSMGTVYFEDHEVIATQSFTDDGALPENMVPVADSFDAFLGMLYDPDHEPA